MSWTLADMLALGTRHATVEAACDLEATMATLVAEPVYEFWPSGLRMQGGALVRRYYENLFSVFIPATRGYELLDEWVNEASVAQEYRIDLEFDGVAESHRVVGILVADEARSGLLGGERIYAGEACARRMLGPLYDELVARR